MDESTKCPEEQVLIDFVGERLDESARRQVEEHLADCGHCSESVEWMKQHLLREITDGLDAERQDVEGSHALESVDGDTEVWDDLMDDEELAIEPLLPSSNKKAIGRLGKYDILGVLGRGGMGVVLKAFDEQLRRTVAIKVLNRRLSTSDTARRRFIREARAAAGINHYNVVTIHAVEEHKHCPFLVMEYVDGGTLHDYIRANRPLEPLTVIRLAREIAAGLAAAHAHGVIHRDIKPGNILLEDGAVRVKISDFGLGGAAVDNVELTSRELAVGTPTYMSPEQVKAEKVDLRSDLFSLGCVMYAMVAGHSPFQGRHALEVARKVTDLTPPPLEKTVEGTPAVLSDMVSKLLAKDPDDRYQSATEVAEVLGRYLAILNETPTDEMSAVLHGRRLHDETRRSAARWMLVTCAVVLVAVLVSLPFVWPRKDTSGSDSDRAAETRGPIPTETVPAGPELVTVAQSGAADVQSINDALARAGPGTVIRVTDNGTYSEAIEIANAARLHGIVLECAWEPGAAPRPTLTVPDATTPVIQVRGVSDIVIRGFRIEPMGGSAIVVSGTLAGLTIEHIECYQIRSEDNEPGVLIQAARRTPGDEPIIIRKSRFHNPHINQCIRVCGSLPTGQHVRIEENTISGRHVLLLFSQTAAPLGRVVVANNVFLGRAECSDTNALNLDLRAVGAEPDICINNNTFLNVWKWFGLAWSEPDQRGVTICNNLILGARLVAGTDERVDGAAENWRFEANWWEFDPKSDFDAGRWESMATTRPEIELLERDDPTDPDFLLPPPDSPLFTSGCGDDGLPAYIGARGP